MKTEVRKAQRLGDVYIHTSKLKGESGITLVALIITIIVLIILATITIKSVLDYNIIQKTVARIREICTRTG